jgi:cobalt-zinc-cadmium efflux system outer membrane protein
MGRTQLEAKGMHGAQEHQKNRFTGITVGARAALLAAVVTTVTPAIPVGAQSQVQSSQAGELRLGDLYRELPHANSRIAAARSLVDAARSRIPGARRPPDPQLQLGFMNYTLPGLAPMETIGMRQLQLMQMIPLPGKLALAGRAARAQASVTEARAEDVSWDVRSRAAMAFYDLHATDGGIAVARETLRLLHAIAATAEAMYRVGDGRQADVLRALVEIAKMEEDTLRMQAMRESMIDRLNAILERNAAAALGSPVLPHFPESVPTRAWLDSIAATGRPMIRAGVDEVRAAGFSERLMRKELIPDLQVGVQYGQRGGEMGLTERMGSVMVGVSLPVFARARQLRMRDEAAAMRQMAEADLAATRAETRGQIGEAYAALNRSRNLARLYRTTLLPQAEATVSSAHAAYRVGSVDFMTLLDDRMTVNTYRQKLYALEADEGKAWAELEMLTGRQLINPDQLTRNSAFQKRADK